ncbi:TonB-dependent receptor [Polluticoccus soli]|uniref:TonB-dependent receptor n=1 Tax=Polluticoccus soli TaxID=3034150 RepID=UPI0023E0F102|nr:TonB-dependent receptor [Flavipsychrobacter sp. JY13-12]
MRKKLRYVFVLCLIVAAFQATAQNGRLLEVAYVPTFSEGTIEAYLADIHDKVPVPISYSTSSVSLTTLVRLRGNERTVGEVLNSILVDQKVSVIEREDKILIVSRDSRKKYLRSEAFVINGYIKEENSKEALIGATVYVAGLQAGTVTNNYGFYSMALPEGDHKIVCNYLGFRPDTLLVSLKRDTRKDFFLTSDNKLAEIKVTQKGKESHDRTHFQLNDIEGSPALLGENDILRTIQNTAGVQASTDGMTNILVRGGDPGQNLYLLDGVPVYYADHILGLTSVFNLDAIKSVDFYKDAFPARFGGRLASVIDVNTKDGDMERIGGQFNMGLVKSSLSLEGPIIKDRASVMLSARRTWIDALWRPFTDDLGFNFYDINGKANYIVNKNNRLYLSIYTGRDRVSTKATLDEFDMRWGNLIGSAKWTSIIDPKLFVNTILTYSKFNFQLREGQFSSFGDTGKVSFNTGRSSINDYSGKVQLHYYPNLKHHVEAGVNYTYSDFNPISVVSEQQFTTMDFNLNINRFQSNEVTLFAEDEIKVGSRWILRPGLHWATWFNADYNYSALQPRMYTAYKLASNHTIYGSFTQMAQYLHYINNNNFGIPVGFYLPSTSRIAPEEALLGTLGYTANFPWKFEYNVEVYYKDILNTTTFDAGKDPFASNIGWEDQVVQGKGWSYGAEFSVKQSVGPFHFDGAYTWSWAWRKFASLNNGQSFPYRYDRRHNIKALLTYEPNKRFSATANWMYMSGEAITLPDQISPDLENNLGVNVQQGSNGGYTYNFSSVNDYRLPPIHRLDVGFNFRKQKRRYMERTWSFGVYNLYGRQNVMYVELTSVASTNEFQLTGISFLQFVPYVNYKLRF